MEPSYSKEDKLNALVYKRTQKCSGFSDGLLHIRDNCYLHIDDKLINIIVEHENFLEYHGINRSIIKRYMIDTLFKQPTLRVFNAAMLDAVKSMTYDQIIRPYNSCKEVRSACKKWEGNYYIHQLYCSYKCSIYGFLYELPGRKACVCLQVVNHVDMNMEGTFTIEQDIIKEIYDKLGEE